MAAPAPFAPAPAAVASPALVAPVPAVAVARAPPAHAALAAAAAARAGARLTRLPRPHRTRSADPRAAPPPQAMPQPVDHRAPAAVVDVELGALTPSNFTRDSQATTSSSTGASSSRPTRSRRRAPSYLRVRLPGRLRVHRAGRGPVDARGRRLEDSAEPGFGARITQISAEGRQLVSRFTRQQGAALLRRPLRSPRRIDLGELLLRARRLASEPAAPPRSVRPLCRRPRGAAAPRAAACPGDGRPRSRLLDVRDRPLPRAPSAGPRAHRGAHRLARRDDLRARRGCARAARRRAARRS